MKSCKLLLSILLIAGLASAGFAMDKDEALHGPTAYVPPSDFTVMGSCATPVVIPGLPYNVTGQTNCGLGNNYSTTCLGLYDGGEEIIYRLDIATTTTVDIVMNPGSTTWTGILLDSACPPSASTCIGTATGSGATPRSILGKTLAPGSYYIMVDTYPAPNCIPSFTLDVTAATPPPPPAVNDVCTGAIDIQDQGLASWDINLTNAGTYYNDYSPALPSCTGYTANGPDAIYSIDLAAGEEVTISMLGNCDTSIWIATDCSNLNNTCVAGADAVGGFATETVVYTAAAAGTYYVIIDAYATGGCPVTVTVNAPVSTENETFGALKAMFR